MTLDIALTLRAIDRMTGPIRTATRNVRASFRHVHDELAKTQSAMIGLGSATFVADALNQTGRSVVGVFTGAVRTAADFEQAMTAVGAVTRATTLDQQRLTQQAKDLGSNTSFSAAQAADGMRFLGMAGFSTNQILAAMPSTLSLARSGMIDLGQAADIGSNILSGFGLAANQMTRIADVMTAVTTRSNVNMTELGETMKYVAPIAKGLGIPLEDAAAAAGLLGNVGIKGSMAGTTLRAAMQRLAAPTGAAADELATLGVMVKDETGNLRPFVAILEDLAAATEGLGTADRTEILKKLFDAEAATGVAELMDQAGRGELRRMASDLGNVEGEAKRVAAAMENTAEGGFRALNSAVEGLHISFGTLLIPAANAATAALRSIAIWLNEFVVAWPWLSSAIGYVVGGFGLLAIVGGVAIKAFVRIYGVVLIFTPLVLGLWAALLWLTKAVWFLGRSLVMLAVRGLVAAVTGIATLTASLFAAAAGALPAVTAAVIAFSAALWANPVSLIIGAIIVAVAALAGAAYLIWDNWEPISTWFASVWDNVKGAWTDFTDWVSGWYDDTFGWIADAFANVAEAFGFVNDQPDGGSGAATSPSGLASGQEGFADKLRRLQSNGDAASGDTKVANNNVSVTINAPGADAKAIASEVNNTLLGGNFGFFGAGGSFQ